jgi:hypothetical protein
MFKKLGQMVRFCAVTREAEGKSTVIHHGCTKIEASPSQWRSIHYINTVVYLARAQSITAGYQTRQFSRPECTGTILLSSTRVPTAPCRDTHLFQPGDRNLVTFLAFMKQYKGNITLMSQQIILLYFFYDM